MKTIESAGAQGDVMFVRVTTIPENLKVQPAAGDRHVLARGDSASGEHFVASLGVTYFPGPDDRTAYLKVETDHVDVVHGRQTDTHETLRLAGPGAWLVRRQREHTPEGFRRVED
jgi:hypothetical protein